MIQIDRQAELSSQDFAGLGLNVLAYVKPVEHEGQDAYAVHTADGQPVAITSTRALALALIRQHDLEPVDAH
jgi:hypothetical protein